MWKRALGLCTAAGWILSACGTSEPTSEDTSQAKEYLVRATALGGKQQVLELQFERYSGTWSRCSGSYFAPRVVLTAAHCIKSDVIPGRAFAYFGTNLEADLPLRNTIPAPGQPTVWAKLDSWEVHPNYNTTQRDADIAVVYLDRKLPFDPVPLFRNRLDSSWVKKMVTMMGWGASKALSADIQTFEGAGVLRTGKAPILGTPTQADYHADDPNPGMLIPAVREHYLKLNGKAPYSNGCAGDSGGPIIVNAWGQDYVAGVASWTGLWCEEYSLYTRLDPYLPFLDLAYMKGGQATLIPHLECVAPRTDGKYTAYFGYQNNNGVSISVPYDTNKNHLPLDAANERPTLYLPGGQHWVFGIDFASNQTAYWKLSPTNSPTTELRATINSPKCSNGKELKCSRNCEATMAAACAADFAVDMQFCMRDCLETADVMIAAGCEAQWNADLACVAATLPDAANWWCDPSWDYVPRPIECDAQLYAALDCYYGAG